MKRDQSMGKTVKIITDKDGGRLVVISKILFKGKRSICWNEVKEYLRQYVGDSYMIEDTKDTVYIGSDFPDEYTGSKYTYSLKGANAKAKANAVQGIPDLHCPFITNREYWNGIMYIMFPC